MKQNYLKLSALFTLLASFQPVHAGAMGPEIPQEAWFVSIEGGAQEPSNFGNLRVYNGSGFAYPYNTDLYSTKKRTHGLLGGTIGYRWLCDESWFPAYSLGLRYQHVFSANAGNRIELFSLPAFINYNYTLDTSSNVLLLAGKLNYYQYQDFLPYINGGVGMAYNHLSNYRENALPGITGRISPAFASETNHSFAFTIGTGFDYMVNDQVLVSVGYEFQHLGKFTTGPGVGTWTSQRLDLGNYHANTILFSAAYLFDC